MFVLPVRRGRHRFSEFDARVSPSLVARGGFPAGSKDGSFDNYRGPPGSFVQVGWSPGGGRPASFRDDRPPLVGLAAHRVEI